MPTMRRCLATAALILQVMASSTSTFAQPDTRNAGREALSIQSDIQRPAGLRDMLVNLRKVIEQQYLIREDFFTDDNLMRCFGGLAVERYGFKSEGKQGGYISGFEGWVGAFSYGSRSSDGISFNFDWFEIDDSNGAMLRVNITGETSLGFDDVERIFGTAWHNPILPPSPHATLKAASHPHGNETIEYVYSSSSLLQHLTIAFRFDGSINLLTLRVRK